MDWVFYQEEVAGELAGAEAFRCRNLLLPRSSNSIGSRRCTRALGCR
jgi:hypothetical protein